jgi:arginyl-tRNA--protein-N-Asp/Glu arginylyltransferase
MEYLHWDEQTIPADSSPEAIAAMYDRGYVFTRKGKGVMQQTRSCRIDLSRFELSSENRRILKKTADVSMSVAMLPYSAYDFTIGKLAKDFYTTKFGDGTLSANKMKEMMTDPTKSNFNLLLRYDIYAITGSEDKSTPCGYAICYKDPTLLHYSFPFYDLAKAPKDMGLGMMIRAIEYALEHGMRYAYLGSLQRPGDIYKLQFAGLEWFDGKTWQTDTAPLKDLLK